MSSNAVLVTGGAGFIGQHLTSKLLSKERRVVVVDDFSTGKPLKEHPKLTVIEGDISDESVRKEALTQVKSVINLAAIASVPLCENMPEVSRRVNYLAAQSLFQEASESGVSAILHASTSALYGVPKQLPLNEKDPINPIGNYGLDKQKAEDALLSIKQSPVCALRLFNVFGLGQQRGSPYSGVLTIFSERIVQNEELTIFGDGHQSRDFIHVNDVVSAFIGCLEDLEKNGIYSKVSGKKFNVCSGESMTLLDVVDSFSSYTENEIVLKFKPPREGDILHSSGSFDSLNKAIGWTPSTDFSERLQELLL
ncbi:MAG: hypothetical protein CMA29_02385 [Euryarchaeota archaeon]|nr:hypothetical protein [Euryarchaeota archaeon]